MLLASIVVPPKNIVQSAVVSSPHKGQCALTSATGGSNRARRIDRANSRQSARRVKLQCSLYGLKQASLATSTRAPMVDDFFTSLKTLEVKGLGIVSKFLGLHVQFQDGGFSLIKKRSRANTLKFCVLERVSMHFTCRVKITLLLSFRYTTQPMESSGMQGIIPQLACFVKVRPFELR